MVLFGSTVLIPEFLQSSLGYTAERAGWALSPGGLVLMLMMPVAGRLTASKLDPRLLIALGFVGTSLGLHLMTTIYLQIDFRTMVLLRMTQVSALPFIFIPISTLNYVGMPREKKSSLRLIEFCAEHRWRHRDFASDNVFIEAEPDSPETSHSAHNPG